MNRTKFETIKGIATAWATKVLISSDGERELLRRFLAADPKLGGVNVQALAARLYARGLRAPAVR